jgi:DNA-binding transcriptional ArsR family regulator
LALELANGPARVTELSDRVAAPQPLVSHHLGILRGSALVRTQRVGSSVIYTLNDEGPVGEVIAALVRGYANQSAHAGGGSHEHGPECGHVAIPHRDHIDYLHDGSLHRSGDRPGRWLDCEPDRHTPHRAHRHVHGEGCGHVAVPHGDHVDYVHDGHRHAAHGDHYDDH